MPILKNARYEIFALAIARGESAHTAYTLAGYKQHRQNAARLMTNEDIDWNDQARLRSHHVSSVCIPNSHESFRSLLCESKAVIVPHASEWQRLPAGCLHAEHNFRGTGGLARHIRLAGDDPPVSRTIGPEPLKPDVICEDGILCHQALQVVQG